MNIWYDTHNDKIFVLLQSSWQHNYIKEPGQTIVVEESLYYIYADPNLCNDSFTLITFLVELC